MTASPPSRPPAGPVLTRTAAVGLGLGVTLTQVVVACVLSGEANALNGYLKLFQWDSSHYAEIVEDGYACPPVLTAESHGNVAFFPGYPLSAWLVRAVTGWTTPASLLAAAQTACWGFWVYVFLLFRRWRVSPRLAALGCLLLASRPAAFFLVAGYSESLFLMSLLGFLYWSGEKSFAALLLAALHGFVMTATRIAGVPVILYPVLHAWLNAPRDAGDGPWRGLARLLPSMAVAGSAALGAGLFFLYCHYRFGHWDLYMRTQFLGWNVRPDYLAFLSGDAYCLGLPTWQDGFFEPGWFSRFTTMLLLPVFGAFFLGEYRWRRSFAATEWRARAGMYAAALLIYYVCASGMSRLNMTSMMRYALGPEVLLVLCLVHMLSRPAFPGGRLRGWLLLGLALWTLLGFWCQVAFALRFTHGLWVA